MVTTAYNLHLKGYVGGADFIASLGAAHISIDALAMYFVHQCSMALFEWGSLNSAQFASLIADCEKVKVGLDGDDLFIEEKCNILKEYLELCDRFDADAVDAYCNILGIEYLGNFEARYQGEYKTMEDFAEYIVNELYNLDRIPGHLS